jgi:hypothetical protein
VPVAEFRKQLQREGKLNSSLCRPGAQSSFGLQSFLLAYERVPASISRGFTATPRPPFTQTHRPLPPYSRPLVLPPFRILLDTPRLQAQLQATPPPTSSAMSDAKLSRKLSRTSDEPYLYESYSKESGTCMGRGWVGGVGPGQKDASQKAAVMPKEACHPVLLVSRHCVLRDVCLRASRVCARGKGMSIYGAAACKAGRALWTRRSQNPLVSTPRYNPSELKILALPSALTHTLTHLSLQPHPRITEEGKYTKTDCLRLAKTLTDLAQVPAPCKEVVQNEQAMRKAFEGATVTDRARHAIATRKGTVSHHQLQRRLTSTSETMAR